MTKSRDHEITKSRYVIAHNGAHVFGGAEKLTAHLLRGLQERGRRVLLLCNYDVVMERAAAYGVPVRKAPLRGDVLFSDAVRFGAIVRREAPDALLFTTFKKIWLGFMGAQLADVPRVVARVGLSTDTPRSMKYRIALRYIDEVVVNAPDIAPAFGAHTRVIPNGVATPPVMQDAASFRAAHGIPRDAFVIGAVARLSIQKRLERIVEAAAALPADTHVLIGGEGPTGVEIEQRARDLGIADRVHLIGHREDVGNVFNALDVYVVSSDLEGLSNSMLEAMSLGKPVVSTPVSGARFALGTDGGIVTDGFGSGNLADALVRLRTSAADRETMGKVAHQRYLDWFTLNRMLDAWDEVLFGSTNGGG